MRKEQIRYRLGGMTYTILLAEIIWWAFFVIAYFIVAPLIPELRFDNVTWAWLGLGGLLMNVIFLTLIRWKNRKLLQFGDLKLLPHFIQATSTTKTLLKFLLVRFAFAWLVITIVNPKMGTKEQEGKTEGIDMMLCLDVSNSMLAEDLKPNRLIKATRAISQLIDDLHGDRIGIIVFAGDAYVQLPITTDYGAAKLFLANINTDIVPVQGTAIGAAIDLAMESFNFENGSNKSIIVISDGENHEDDAVVAAERAKAKNVVVHTIGMGSVQGAPIPHYVGSRKDGFKQDKEGNTVVSKLDEQKLASISSAADGIFVRASNTQVGLKTLLEEIQNLDKVEFETVVYTDYEDRFQWFAGMAWILLVIDTLLSERKIQWFSNLNLLKKKEDKQ
jgi:Ca-activated chloride channel family protein